MGDDVSSQLQHVPFMKSTPGMINNTLSGLWLAAAAAITTAAAAVTTAATTAAAAAAAIAEMVLVAATVEWTSHQKRKRR